MTHVPCHLSKSSPAKDASQTPIMATTQLASSVPSYEDPSSSQSSSGSLSGGKIAAIAIGTVLAVGVVCLLLFCLQLLFARLMKSRSRNRPSGREKVSLKDPPPQRPDRASGNDGSSNGGADDAGSRRRRPEVVLLHGGSTQQHRNQVIVNRPAGDPVIINNNIYIDSNDYLHPLPALNSQRNRNPAPPAIGIRRNSQRASGIRDVQHFGDPPNGGTPPQRRRHVDLLRRLPGLPPWSNLRLLGSGMWRTGPAALRQDRYRVLRLDGIQAGH